MNMFTNQRIWLILGVMLFLLPACETDQLEDPVETALRERLQITSPTGDLEGYILPDSRDFDRIPQDPKNPLTEVKVELGRMLFFETGLALAPVHDQGKGTYSCGSCHIPEAGFMAGRMQGIADGGLGFGLNGERRTKSGHYREDELDVQGARPLSLINVAYVTNTSWPGKFGSFGANEGTEEVWGDDPTTEVNFLGLSGLEAQNIEGLKIHRMVVNKEVTDSLGYTPYFDAAFPEFPEEERYGFMTASFAISAYLRTLLPNHAPFQKWLKGDSDALTTQEKRGAMLFFGKAGCFRCHNGPALNDADNFYALGVLDLYQMEGAFGPIETDSRIFGRGGFTKRSEDMYKFKVPQLYNLKASPFYFHGSSKRSLREVVEYFNEAVPENPNVPAEQIAPQFHPLNLSEREIEDLVAFLENALYDHDMERFMPEQVLSGNCFPNNDLASRFDLGCE